MRIQPAVGEFAKIDPTERPGIKRRDETTPMSEAITTSEDLFTAGSVTIEGLETEFGIGRTTAYELMNAGRLPWSKTTGRRLVPRAAVRRLLAQGLIGGQQVPGDNSGAKTS